MQNFLTEFAILSKIIEGSPIPSFVINKQHLVTHWNTAIEALSGVKKNNVIGTGGQWTNFYKEKRPTMADLIVDGAPEDAISIFYRGKCEKSSLIEGAYEAEDFFPALGEQGKWVNFTASPIKNNEGEIIGAIETLQDITEKLLAREALSQSEKSFRDLFESAFDAIWVNDLDGNIIMANTSCTLLTGYTRERLMRSNIGLFLTPECLELMRGVQSKLINYEPVDMPYQHYIKRSDDIQLIVELTTRQITQNGTPTILFQNIARDVTIKFKMRENMRFYLQKVLVAQEEERKRIARELHDDTAQMLGSLSRQLDNFVRKKNALSSSEILFLKDMQTQLNQGVQEVHRFSQALRLSLLEDFGLIPALRSLLKNLQETGGINAELTVEGEERRYRHELETMLYRIVQEAVSNITKHAQATKANVIISFGEDRIVVSVVDNGRGFTLPESINEFPRSGKLGLTGIQERTQLLGGTLKLESSPGKGTTLTVEVPNYLTSDITLPDSNPDSITRLFNI